MLSYYMIASNFGSHVNVPRVKYLVLIFNRARDRSLRTPAMCMETFRDPDRFSSSSPPASLLPLTFDGEKFDPWLLLSKKKCCPISDCPTCVDVCCWVFFLAEYGPNPATSQGGCLGLGNPKIEQTFHLSLVNCFFQINRYKMGGILKWGIRKSL